MKPIEIARKILQEQSRPNGAFCLICGNHCAVNKEENEGAENFVCQANPEHIHPRALIFDPKVSYQLTEHHIIHPTVGIVIVKKQKTPYFLLFLRRRFPYQYTIPAGHVEQDVSLEKNAQREIKEETSLKIKNLKQLWSEEELILSDPCRRGADCHQWYVFEAETEGYPRLCKEGRIIGWYTQDEIISFHKNQLITEASYIVLSKYWSN